jgi:hypothetical protein
MALNEYVESLMPEDVRTNVHSSYTMNRTGNVGYYQGGDACLEVNKDAKGWIKQRMREKIQRLVVTGKQQKDSTTSGYEEATTRFGNQVRVELTLFGQHNGMVIPLMDNALGDILLLYTLGFLFCLKTIQIE